MPGKPDMMSINISPAVIKRLPRYYRYLGELKDEGVMRISSRKLSEMMHVTASQIRQDLNHFGGFGQQGYGYNVRNLYDEIGKILGLDKDHKLVVIGAGHLGQALSNYVNFERRGFHILGIFDKDPLLIGKKIRDVTVSPMEKEMCFAPTEIFTSSSSSEQILSISERAEPGTTKLQFSICAFSMVSLRFASL